MKLHCPKCRTFVDPSPGMLSVFAFCPHCGHPLAPPPDCLRVDDAEPNSSDDTELETEVF